jgi:hypothetical protein
MSRQKQLIVTSIGVLLLIVAGWAGGRFLLLPGSSRTFIEIPGDPANAQMWLRLRIEPDTVATFDILNLDIARNTTGPTRCYSSLIFSQETPYPFTTHPADFFVKSSPTDGYSRSYMYNQETGIQGQTANYDLLNVCDSVNPHLSTFNSARILAPVVAANADTRRLLVGAVRNRYFYPFDKYTISFAGISLLYIF